MKGLHGVAFILLIIGGLNWLLLGVFQWEVGNVFGGQSTVISRLIYIVVGLAALYELFTHKRNCRQCENKMASSAPQGGM